MSNNHIEILHHFHFPLLKKRVKDLYLTHAINSFAFSLIGIFIPIYLVQLGFSLPQVLFYFIVRSIAISSFAFLVMYIANNLGLKQMLYIRLPIVILFLALLSNIKNLPLMYIVALLDGLQVAIYWMPMHSLFVRSSAKKHIGSQVSRWFSFPKLLTMFGPLIGGLIAAEFSFSVLFLTAIIVLTTSLFPLYYAKEIKPHVNFEFKEGLKLFKKYNFYFFAAIAEGALLATESVIWPLFVFSILGTIISLGFVGTLLGLGSIIFMLIIGSIIDKYGKKRVLYIGVPIISTIWILRIFATTEMKIYAVTLLAGFFLALLTLPFTSLTYDLAKKNNIDEFILFRETALTIGRITFLALTILLVDRIASMFLIGSVTNLLFLLA